MCSSATSLLIFVTASGVGAMALLLWRIRLSDQVSLITINICSMQEMLAHKKALQRSGKKSKVRGTCMNSFYVFI